jgi:hypothetical protein
MLGVGGWAMAQIVGDLCGRERDRKLKLVVRQQLAFWIKRHTLQIIVTKLAPDACQEGRHRS